MATDEKTVCVTGGGFSNKGAEAMLLTVVQALRDRLPTVRICIPVSNKIAQQKANDNGLIPVGSTNPSPISRTAAKVRRLCMYYRSHAFIDVGGYAFGDPFGEKTVLARVSDFRHCVRFKRPLFFMPQAWGPFSCAVIAEATRHAIEMATVSYVRDRVSAQAVEMLVGKDNPKVRFAYDIAWLFQGEDLFVGRRLIETSGLARNGHPITIGLTPNVRVYERSEGVETDNVYIRFLSEMIEHLCLNHHARVILIGHDLRENSRQNDDRNLCEYIRSLLRPGLPVGNINTVLTAAEIKSVIGNCDFIIASRYHALIAALSQKIPVAAIGWAHKYQELLNDVGLSLNMLSLPKQGVCTFRTLDEMIERRQSDAAIIAQKILPFQQSARESLTYVINRVQDVLEG